MSKEVGILEATGEPTNASAARGTTPTLVVRGPDDESRPEIPAMTLRSHSRGGRSSACAQEPSSQAGSYPTGNESLGVHSTRQEKSGPEPEMHSNHTNYPTDPTSVGTGLHPPPSENNPTDTQPPQVHISPHQQRQVFTGPQRQVFTCFYGKSHALSQLNGPSFSKLYGTPYLRPNGFTQSDEIWCVVPCFQRAGIPLSQGGDRGPQRPKILGPPNCPHTV